MEPKEYLSKNRIKNTGLPILLVLIFAWGLYSQISLRKELKSTKAELKQLKGDPNVQTQSEVTKLIETITKLVVLPTGETPTIATVTDLSKLKDQAFFKDAAIGDKVLIYKESKRAILFRPSTNKVIEYASLETEVSPNLK